MDYFTPEWHRGDVEEHPAEEYQKHLAPLLPSWPPDVQVLAACVSLHDGLIRELSWDMGEATLFLRLRCGDLQVGYFDLDLHYSGVLFSPLDWTSLLTLNANKNSSALYDEVDDEDGRFAHRILFLLNRRVRPSRRINIYRRIKLPLRRAKRKFQYHEVVVRFRELRLVTAPRESRSDAR